MVARKTMEIEFQVMLANAKLLFQLTPNTKGKR